MSMERCFIGLGSNLSNPVDQLQQAIGSMADLAHCKFGALSSFYASKPLGSQNQPDYVNAVVELFTELNPHQLLDQLQAIEQQQGRVRTGLRWGARTLDLDILLYGEQKIYDERLIVPHYDIAQRNFVLYPLAEIVEAEFTLPDLGSLKQLLDRCDQSGLTRLSQGI